MCCKHYALIARSSFYLLESAHKSPAVGDVFNINRYYVLELVCIEPDFLTMNEQKSATREYEKSYNTIICTYFMVNSIGYAPLAIDSYESYEFALDKYVESIRVR